MKFPTIALAALVLPIIFLSSQAASADVRGDFIQAWIEMKYEETCLEDSAVRNLISGKGLTFPKAYHDFESDFVKLSKKQCSKVKPQEMSGACLEQIDDLMTKTYEKGLQFKCNIRDDFKTNKANAVVAGLADADKECSSINPGDINESRLRKVGDNCTITVRCKSDARFFEMKLQKELTYKLTCKKREGYASCSEMDINDCQEPRISEPVTETAKTSPSFLKKIFSGGAADGKDPSK